MTDVNRPISFSILLERCGSIVVPLIQRDYAQGRESEKEIRDDFLNALYLALTQASGDGAPPLNLDFIYGSMEGSGNVFLPLDGQQRLTTLFLLHWYLAWCDGELAAFRNMAWGENHSRFSYRVRPSSTEFFDELVKFSPDSEPSGVWAVRWLLEEQPWFFLNWRLDPTIQSALAMLDAIHQRFQAATGLYRRLVDATSPAVTFQLLELEHFGLSDDLYIKMNARGKPLTTFETFKARFEEHLKALFGAEQRMIDGVEVAVPQFVERRMDTRWTDFFWTYKDEKTNTFDNAVMNLLWALVRAGLDPDSPSFSDDTSRLRNRYLSLTFTVLHEQGWLSRPFAEKLICLLEAWSAGGDGLTRQLPDDRYFDEMAFFRKAISVPATLEYTELVEFAAYVSYLHLNEGNIDGGQFQEWMRVVFNLVENSGIERPEEFGRSLAGVRALLPHSRDILRHLAGMEVESLGFSPQQIREEILKAKLMLAHTGWTSRIVDAESHGYFRGQIEFLLDFAGVIAAAKQETKVEEWEEPLHRDLQLRFDEYLAKAQIMFDSSGLAAIGPYLWQRALLTVGNYLTFGSSNYSFLTNPATHWDSWKRYLRGSTAGESPSRRLLKILWDRLDATADVAPQLEKVIEERSGLEAWCEAIVRWPQTIDYCWQREIRKKEPEIYLLRKKQMNGAHAELFSYALHQELGTKTIREKLDPLSLAEYRSVDKSDVEPKVVLTFGAQEGIVLLTVESTGGKFCIRVTEEDCDGRPDVWDALVDKTEFAAVPGELNRVCSRNEILAVLFQIAGVLRECAQGESQ